MKTSISVQFEPLRPDLQMIKPMLTGKAPVWFHNHHMTYLNHLRRQARLNTEEESILPSDREFLTADTELSLSLFSSLHSSSTSSILTHVLLYNPLLRKRTQVMWFQKEGVGGPVCVCFHGGKLWLRLRGRSLLNRGTVRSNSSSVFVCRGWQGGERDGRCPALPPLPPITATRRQWCRPHQTACMNTRDSGLLWANKQVLTGAQQKNIIPLWILVFEAYSS